MPARAPAPSTVRPTHVALLRGVNVGGKNLLPMAELVSLFEEAGCSAVESYIQSGNVLFAAPAAAVRRLPEQLAARIEERHGLRVPVIVRAAADLRRILAGNPFLARGADPKTLHVAFLAARPSKAAVGKLDPGRSPPDAFEVRGEEVFLSFPNGVGRSKLTNDYLDRTLGTVSTLRNWNTVAKLAALLGG